MRGRLRAARSRFDDILIQRFAEILARLAERQSSQALRHAFYRHGFHFLRRNYDAPIPDDSDNLEQFWKSSSDLRGIDTNDSVALDLLRNVYPPYLREFRARFPIHKPTDERGFYLINGRYMAVDAHVYYSLIRARKPRRIIEIGCGSSTILASAALETNAAESGEKARFTSIDPFPWDVFRNGYPGLTELIARPVQSVSLSLFETLQENDILFIDSSHVVRSGNDVLFEYLEILPRLKPGVLVHIHDISLPKPYPKTYYDNQLYWTEQYLLQAFLMFNSRFEVLWAGNYMLETYREEMSAAFPEIAIMRGQFPSSEPSAFWMRVSGPA
jgi:predicted O-methyltransferase YrrM